MTRISDRTVLFADLRGSTSLFETLGNAEATSVVTHCVTALAAPVGENAGTVVKTLGDGLMAVFDDPEHAVEAAVQMHEVLEAIASRGSERGASSGLRALRLQVAMARGELVEMAGDCYGDAVNVAARLLDHAGDNETLITVEVLTELPSELRSRFRSLDRLALRGRVEPVQVHVLGGQRAAADAVPTQFSGLAAPDAEPDGLRLSWNRSGQNFGPQMPVVLGRSPESSFCVDDTRVSRSHARIDWHGGSFQLTDLSYNGTCVRFADGEIVSLRRGSCTLHGSGEIGLGGSPNDPDSAVIAFDVLRIADTQAMSGVDPALSLVPVVAMRVLYVDDDRVNALLFAETCRVVGGIEVESADNAADALELAQPFAPDLLVIDLHLPDRSGLDLLPALRERLGSRVPAMLCTADRIDEVEASARDAGFDGCWTKPVVLTELMAELSRRRDAAAAPRPAP